MQDVAVIPEKPPKTKGRAEAQTPVSLFDIFIGYKNKERFIKEEGALALFTGLGPTVARAIAMNVGMLSTFDQAKESLESWKGEKGLLSTRLQASAIAGCVCSVMSLPFDNVKTKLQKMKATNGVYPYAGVVDCLKQTVAREGVTGLWVGLPTYYFRVAPHAMIT